MMKGKRAEEGLEVARTGDREYAEWLAGVKANIRRAQIKAAVRVNEELLRLYWDMGRDISLRRLDAHYGSGFFATLSRDLRDEFPDMEGFSVSNLKYVKRFYEFYAPTVLHQLGAKSEPPTATGKKRHQAGDEWPGKNRQQGADELGEGKRQQVADDFKGLFCIPWWHHVEIFTHAGSVEEALFYVAKTAENGWSRSVLTNMMEAGLFEAQGRAVTNFAARLPEPESDLARQTLKDPYCFDFLALRERHTERELEDALVENIARFLLELGSGFSFVGRQWRLEVGGEEFFIDLLFYHLKLRRYVVVELKTGDFKPEFVGQLGFYVQAVNAQLKHPTDEDAIGLLICKRHNRLVAKYALGASSELLGVSEYKLTKLLPAGFRSSLPSVGEIESGLGGESAAEEKKRGKRK